MSVGDSNGAAGYQVSYSEAVRQQMKRLAAGLSQGDELRRFAAALRVIHARLRKDPLIFGEHKFSLPPLRLTVRMASVQPMVVWYGVHDERPLVFVRNFELLGGGEP